MLGTRDRNDVAFERGGGLSVYVEGDSYDNLFEIVHCTNVLSRELKNATWGGGMLAEFRTMQQMTPSKLLKFIIIL